MSIHQYTVNGQDLFVVNGTKVFSLYSQNNPSVDGLAEYIRSQLPEGGGPPLEQTVARFNLDVGERFPVTLTFDVIDCTAVLDDLLETFESLEKTVDSYTMLEYEEGSDERIFNDMPTADLELSTLPIETALETMYLSVDALLKSLTDFSVFKPDGSRQYRAWSLHQLHRYLGQARRRLNRASDHASNLQEQVYKTLSQYAAGALESEDVSEIDLVAEFEAMLSAA